MEKNKVQNHSDSIIQAQWIEHTLARFFVLFKKSMPPSRDEKHYDHCRNYASNYHSRYPVHRRRKLGASILLLVGESLT